MTSKGFVRELQITPARVEHAKTFCGFLSLITLGEFYYITNLIRALLEIIVRRFLCES